MAEQKWEKRPNGRRRKAKQQGIVDIIFGINVKEWARLSENRAKLKGANWANWNLHLRRGGQM
jgi:hypothetical protein